MYKKKNNLNNFLYILFLHLAKFWDFSHSPPTVMCDRWWAGMERILQYLHRAALLRYLVIPENKLLDSQHSTYNWC